jgi:hypothetical protein
MKLNDLPDDLQKAVNDRFSFIYEISKYKDIITVVGEYRGQNDREHRVDYINGQGYEKY